MPRKRAGRPTPGTPHRCMDHDPPSANGSSRSDRSLVAARKHQGACPVCGRPKLDVTRRPGGGWWVGCWRCTARGLSGGDYMRALAAAVGAPGGGALLENPLKYLRPWLHRAPSRRTPEQLPSKATVDGWHSRLMASDEPLDYLTERGLLTSTLVSYRLGWDGEAITIPVFDASGELVNVRRRRLERGAKPIGLGGRGSQLYPDMPPGRGVVLAAGEFDALLARQHGLPAVTTTCGARLPDHLVPALAGRRVAVVYDVGEDVAAASAEKLVAAGAEAWVVRLGLPREGDDLTDWFVTYGRSRRELVALIRRERTAA